MGGMFMEIHKSSQMQWLKIIVLFLIGMILTACVQFAHEPVEDLLQVRFFNEANEELQEEEVTGTFRVVVPKPVEDEEIELYLEQDEVETPITYELDSNAEILEIPVTIKEEGSYRFLVRTIKGEVLIKEEASLSFHVHDVSAMFAWQKQEESNNVKQVNLSFQKREAVDVEVVMVSDHKKVPASLTWNENQAELIFDQEGRWYVEAHVSYHDQTWTISDEKQAFIIDHSAPLITMKYGKLDITKKAADVFTKPETIELSIEDAYLQMEDTVFDVNGETQSLAWSEKEGTALATWKIDQTGTYELRLCASDQAGNKSCVASKPLIYDDQSPKIQVSMDQAVITKLPTYLNHEITLVIQVEDAYFDHKRSVIYDNQTAITNEWTFTNHHYEQTITLQEGEHYLEIHAYDLANHKTTMTLETIIDVHAPIVQLRYEPQPAYRDDVLISFEVKEEHFQWEDAFVRVTQKNEMIPFTGVFQSSKTGGTYEGRIKEEGAYTISLHIKDLAGNEASYIINDTNQSSFTHECYLDRTPPIVKLSYSELTDNDFYGKPRTMKVQVEDDHIDINQFHMVLYQDQAIQDVNLIWEKQHQKYITAYEFGEDGEYQIRMEFSDEAGNKAMYEINQTSYELFPIQSFVIDQTPPELTLRKSIEGDYSNKDVLITSTMKEQNPSLVHLRVLRDGELIQEEIRHDDTIKEVKLKAEQEGTYHIELTAYDQAGNKAERELNVIMDQTPPKIMTRFNAFTAQHEHEFITNQDTLITTQWSDQNLKQADAILTRNKERLPLTIHNQGFSTTLAVQKESEATYELQIQAEDLAGNVTTNTYRLRMDTYLPKIEFTDDPFLGKPKNISWKPALKLENDAFRVTEAALYRNQMLVQEYHWNDEIKAEGSYQLALTIRDDAMNEATLLPPFSFVIDQTPPTIRIEEDRKREELLNETVSISTKLRVYVHDEVSIKPNIKVLSLDDQSIKEDAYLIDEDGQPYYLIAFTEAKPTTLLVQVSDEAGNETKESMTFQVSDQITKEEVKTIPKPLQKSKIESSHSMQYAIYGGLGISAILFLWVVKRYVH